jgi:hypothetical protein
VETALPRYVASGRYHRSLSWRLLRALAVGVVLMAGYQWLQAWLPHGALRGFLALVAAFLVGIHVDLLLKASECRNRPLAFGLALALALADLAASHGWGWWFARQASLSPELAKALTLAGWLDCRQSADCMTALVGEAGWGSRWVGGAWLAEALLFVFSALTLAKWRMEEPFCEACGRWMPLKTFKVTGVGREEALSRARRGELAGLVALEGFPGVEDYTLVFTCAACPGCERTYLSVREEKQVTVGKARNTVKTGVLELVELPPPEGQRLRERASAAPAKAA